MIQENPMPPPRFHPQSRPRLFATVLNLFSSVWLGVFWAVLLFFYCSIGSALPAFRQLPALEMTEFEWFHWWPFNVLMVLFATTLIVVTVRRIPLRLVNAGVWMIHAGIIILCIGSYYYFGTKVEGDAPVFRRRISIEGPDWPRAGSLVALPGASLNVTTGSGAWRFQVQSTDTAWKLLSGPDIAQIREQLKDATIRGDVVLVSSLELQLSAALQELELRKDEKVYAVFVLVTPPSGEPFVRQLLAGYPQYTEDIIPGKGRALKSLGRKLLDENLRLELDYEPQEYFHVMDTWALFVRRVGQTQWSQRPINGLPRYNDRIGSRDQVFTDPHEPLPLRSIDLAVPPPSEGDALGAAPVRITGYLRYAQMDHRWREGGDRLNPLLQISVMSEDSPAQSYEMAAFDPAHNLAADGNVRFVWLGDFSKLQTLPADSRALLHIAVPQANVSFDLPITPQLLDGPPTPIEGTEFAYRVLNLHDNLMLPGRERPVSIAVVEVQTPQGSFRRWVADQPEHTRDLRGDDADPHATEVREVDPRIQMAYQPGSPPLIFAGHPGGLHFVFNGPHGRMIDRAVKPGDTVEIIPEVSVRVDRFLTHALTEEKPYVVPLAARRRNAEESFAMIRLEVESGHGVQSKWVPFNQYVFPDAQYAYGGRFPYSPVPIRLADGTAVEVIFSRRRLKLPNPIAMEDFELDTHIGGYTGSVSTIQNYVSRLRFLDDGKWSEPRPIAVNHPTEYGGFWYFQSMWDRPPQNDASAGMNYTGLGIGNRHGVYVQLAGCCIAVAGMIFAFYVKPAIKRRRAAQSRGRLASATFPVDDTLYAQTSLAGEQVGVDTL